MLPCNASAQINITSGFKQRMLLGHDQKKITLSDKYILFSYTGFYNIQAHAYKFVRIPSNPG